MKEQAKTTKKVSRCLKPMSKMAATATTCFGDQGTDGRELRHQPERAPDARSYAGVLCVPWLKKYIDIFGSSAGVNL